MSVPEPSYDFQNFCLAPGVLLSEPIVVFAPAFPCYGSHTAFVAAAPIFVETLFWPGFAAAPGTPFVAS